MEFKEILISEYLNISSRLQSSHSEAIVLFTNADDAKMILGETIKLRQNRTWIGSDGWSTSDMVYQSLPYVPGKILGVTCKTIKMANFVSHVKEIINHPEISDGFLGHALKNESAPMSVNDTQNCITRKCLMDFIDNYNSYEPYTVYLAVKFISEAVQRIIKTNQIDFPLSLVRKFQPYLSSFYPKVFKLKLWF